ncbi:MAG: response regulator [Syntrophobacteraceae bacterium]|nr:response regulator [Syntrophobacteraceae bacterium]
MSTQAEQAACSGFTGMINLSLTDLIQMVCLSRSDIVIRVRSGETDGIISIRKGQVLHAETNGLGGEQAFLEIFRWKDGVFEILATESISQCSIHKPWEHLLLEAMRERDEQLDQEPSDLSGDHLEWDAPAIPPPCPEHVAFRDVVDAKEESPKSIPPFQDTAPPPRTDASRPLRVLVVDDSAFFTRQLQRLIEADRDIEVVKVAANGKEALEYLDGHPAVDLITLDIHMPVMQGDTTLKHIMIRHPIPVLIMSALDPRRVSQVLDFLQLGALDVLAKPEPRDDAATYGTRLRSLIRGAARAEMSCFKRLRRTEANGAPLTGRDIKHGERALLIVGAEGAHQEWLRLPLKQLGGQGLVLGLQRIAAPLLSGFARHVGELTGALAVPLGETLPLRPGRFQLGNGDGQPVFRLRPAPFAVDMDLHLDGDLPWEDRIGIWMRQLSSALGSRLSVCMLSGISPIDAGVLEHLASHDSRLILPSATTLVCRQMIRSVLEYAQAHSLHVFRTSYRDLMEVWAEDASPE